MSFSTKTRLRIVVLLVLGLAFIFGAPTFAQSPTVSMISPAPGEVVYGDKIEARVRVPDNFRLGQDGYLYFWLDAPFERTSSNATIAEEAQRIFEHVAAGLHTLWVELVDQNYTSFSPKVEAMVEFETIVEVQPGAGGGGQGAIPPKTSGGFLLPSGNTLAAIIFIGAAIAVLWYLFGRQKKTSSRKG